MSFWQKIFGGKKTGGGKSSPDPGRYEREKIKATTGTVADRLKLAKDKSTHQEILFYLAAHDPDARVRAAVADNKTTPIQASGTIAKDKDQDVRMALAQRLVALLPDVSQDKHSQLYAFAVDALGTLALDEVLKIRVALSSVLKDHAFAPPEIVGQLARDIERQVSEPVLRFCLALPDADLLEILKAHPESWVVQAIAGRTTVSEPVSQAVIDTNDEPAGVVLMGNKGAVISAATMKSIVEKAKDMTSWQRPIAMRKNLPPDLARELAGFVDQSVKTLLLERTDFDAEVMEEISAIVMRRLDFLDDKQQNLIPPEDRVRKLAASGKLDDESVMDALSVCDTEFVILALAHLVKTSRANIERILQLKAPKPVISICWKAGLSMRTALRVEKEIARIPAAELIYPRGGTDYPLSEDELIWQLEFVGISV